MVRYNFEFINRIEILDRFTKMLERYNIVDKCEVKLFLNSKSVGYKYLYQIKMYDYENFECSFVIGIQLNCKTENKFKGFIEFNPNKCMQLTQFEIFLNQFYELLCAVKLVRYDLAIDIPIKRDLARLRKNGKSNYEFLKKGSKEGLLLKTSVTEYSGIREKNYYTKLYDKTKESNLDYDLTRLEITFNKNELSFSKLPSVYIYDYDTFPNDSIYVLKDNDLVLIDLLRNCNDIEFNLYLKRLTYHKRKKIEPYLTDKALKYDIKTILKVRDDALSFEI